jgi:tRNA/tmRNA/rRNA uracil-C5-methylase (TrmA/RlmC/RlmD family)
VVDVLMRIGKNPAARALVRPVLPCAQPLRYRNKMTFHFAPDTVAPSPKGFGLHSVGDVRRVLPVWDCWLQDEGAARILQLLSAASQTHEDTEQLPRLHQRLTVRAVSIDSRARAARYTCRDNPLGCPCAFSPIPAASCAPCSSPLQARCSACVER